MKLKYQQMAEAMAQAETQIQAGAAQLQEVIGTVRRGIVPLPEAQETLLLALERLAQNSRDIAESVKWHRRKIMRS